MQRGAGVIITEWISQQREACCRTPAEFAAGLSSSNINDKILHFQHFAIEPTAIGRRDDISGERDRTIKERAIRQDLVSLVAFLLRNIRYISRNDPRREADAYLSLGDAATPTPHKYYIARRSISDRSPACFQKKWHFKPFVRQTFCAASINCSRSSVRQRRRTQWNIASFKYTLQIRNNIYICYNLYNTGISFFFSF